MGQDIFRILSLFIINLTVSSKYSDQQPHPKITSIYYCVYSLNRNLEATKNNLSCLQVLECGSKIITTPDGLYVLKGDLPEGRNYVAHVINGDYNANSAKIEKVIIQDNNVVVQFVGAVNNPFRLNYVIFSVP